MIGEIGQFSLILAFLLTLLPVIVVSLSRQQGLPPLVLLVKRIALLQFFALAISFACLTWSFIQDDFSLRYVVKNSNSFLPIFYKISAVWGGHEGSLLLWALMLGVWIVAVVFFSQQLPARYLICTLTVMSVVLGGFLLLILSVSNPFERLEIIPIDGNDLNPLLQDPGLIFHPPLLYLGYVGFSVVFAFAIAALWLGKFDQEWARWCRPWVLAAWSFLTLGITLGSWWAYHELGWGGWWFWDPVENASFMPWLVGTALFHSLAVSETRDTSKSWVIFLALLTFSLSLIGTFLVRSGVLISVHAFVSDPGRGIFILLFLTLVIGASLILYAMRASAIKSSATFHLLSRENFLLTNNVILVVVMFSLLTATLYPLAMDALNMAKISVGKPYFDAVFVPLMLPLVFLAGIAPAFPWSRNTRNTHQHQIKFITLVAASALVATITMVYFVDFPMQNWPLLALVGVFASFWIIASSFFIFLRHRHTFSRATTSWKNKLLRTSLPAFGMCVAHTGVGVFVLGITATNTFGIEKTVVLGYEQSTELAGYRFTLTKVTPQRGKNYQAQVGEVDIFRHGKPVATLYPERRVYRVQKAPMTETAIDVRLLRDLSVSLGKEVDSDGWVLRIYYRPLIRWIWGGALLMVFGACLSLVHRISKIRQYTRDGVGDHGAEVAE